MDLRAGFASMGASSFRCFGCFEMSSRGSTLMPRDDATTGGGLAHGRIMKTFPALRTIRISRILQQLRWSQHQVPAIPAVTLAPIYWKQKISQNQGDVVRSSCSQHTLEFFFGTCEQLCKDEATAGCLHNMQDRPGSAHLKSRWCYSLCMQHHRRDSAMGLSRHYHGGRDHCRCSDPKSRNLEPSNSHATPEA